MLDRVYEYLDGEMDQHDLAKIRQHLEECRPCLSQYDIDLAMKALLRRSCTCEPAPQELRARILIRITEVRARLGS
ncbi:MAG TPA: mycothiol system anti-sigma-R factor [Kineosporiaceae bacterium]|nr:mycothiol system anti-sigma-R factor [Kineosporiaceae bacterium]